MKTSVVIATLNRPEKLRNLLDSIEKGTLKPDEVIVVEQGDVEKTREAVRDCNLPINVFFQEEKSSSIARNRGVSESSGEIIFFFDDDMVLGEEYLSIACEYLNKHKNALGLTGTYTRGTPKYSLKRIFAILFGIYSFRARNIVLSSGSYDFIRGNNTEEEQVVEWMYGGNMVLRREVFTQGFAFNPNFKKWSFGEDVMLTYQISKKHKDSLKYLPNLLIEHKEGVEGKMLPVEVLRMKIIYRYIFWKTEVSQGSPIRTLAYLWSQIGLALLDLSKYPSLNTFFTIVSTHAYVLKNGRAILDNAIDYNAFIFNLRKKQEFWRISVFGKFPFVRLKQMITYPPYFFYFLKRFFYYKYISHRYIPKYNKYTFLSPEDTLDKLIDENLSLARFGDGDIEQLTGAGEYPPDSDWSQRASKKLIKRLGEVLSVDEPKLLIAHTSPEIFCQTKDVADKSGQVYNMWTDTRILLWKYLKKGKVYGNANIFIPSHQNNFNWSKLGSFLKDQNVIIVTGGIDKLSEVSLGKQTFFIETGKHDAFERYEDIVKRIKQMFQDSNLKKENTLIMASLGPTADILAFDLSKEGYRVWDTGHIFKFASKELKGLTSK